MAEAVQETKRTGLASTRRTTKPVRTKLEITVLYGGMGPEREVSLQSGVAVAQALIRRGHSVDLCDLTPDRLAGLDDVGDVAFIALHGAFGEDGTLQRALDDRGIRYCGADAAASSLAMDKVAAKRRCINAGLPTPPYVVATAEQSQRGFERAVATLRLPVVVKPTDSGSSVDTYICRSVDPLLNVIDRVTNQYGRALIECCIEGPELTVGILDGEALPVCQIRTRREFYNYQAKYLDNDTEYLFDMDLPATLLRRVQELSRRAFEVLGCRDFGRVDWMVDASTGEPFFLEVNSIPGFTSHSLLPKAAARIGISFDDLCQRIIDLTMARKRSD